MSAESSVYAKNDPRLGIIGGGQLGMLLCRAARNLGIPTSVLTPDPCGPAVYAADDVMIAKLDDAQALADLVHKCSVITFELEAVPDIALERLAQAASREQVVVHPEPATMACLKDKGSQKAWLVQQGLPTLPFELAGSDVTERAVLNGRIRPPIVQKTRRGGYDGRGVQILLTVDALKDLWPVASVLEPALEHCKEVSVLVASDGARQLRAYPPVSMTFDPLLNAVQSVTSPASVSADVLLRCEAIACAAVGALRDAGVFAVELFITPDDEIYINEISPRVHNSGHLTIEAFRHNQFEQHVRAVMGLPLAPVIPRVPAAVMLNLLYDDSLAPALKSGPYCTSLDDRSHSRLHWYGKGEPRPGRKMGHLTAVGTDPDVAAKRAHAGLARIRRGQVTGDYSTAPSAQAS